MKIVLLFPNFPSIGIQKDGGQIPAWLVKMGHDVTLLTNNCETNKYFNDFYGVKVIKKSKFNILSIYFGLFFYIIRNIKNIDCFYMYHLTLNTAILSLIYRCFSKKSIIMIKLDNPGRTWTPEVPLIFKLYKPIIGELKLIPKIISHTANILISESPESAERLLKQYPYMKSKISIIPDGINPEILTPKFNIQNIKKHKKIMMAGQIIPRKGIDLLIKAFSLIKNEFPEWRIEAIGDLLDSDYYKNTQVLIKKHGLENRVTFTNHLTGDNLLKKYLESEVFCFPSRHESFGIVLLEAMYLGIPIVSSDAGCAQYILDNGNSGFLFKSENIEDLSSKLRIILKNDILRNKIAEVAKLRCEKLFLWETIIKDMHNLLLKQYKTNQ
ncbi:MAG: hypothetical protein A2252_03170 [Elusimicrobia bacterium RIFOXYA2_FULL_39_19]|nr:MAG: hypothetical protein A2252_03170 [Elusimicrobia bacterium RIFOXYA2_FULL_39_19]